MINKFPAHILKYICDFIEEFPIYNVNKHFRTYMADYVCHINTEEFIDGKTHRTVCDKYHVKTSVIEIYIEPYRCCKRYFATLHLKFKYPIKFGHCTYKIKYMFGRAKYKKINISNICYFTTNFVKKFFNERVSSATLIYSNNIGNIRTKCHVSGVMVFFRFQMKVINFSDASIEYFPDMFKRKDGITFDFFPYLKSVTFDNESKINLKIYLRTAENINILQPQKGVKAYCSPVYYPQNESPSVVPYKVIHWNRKQNIL